MKRRYCHFLLLAFLCLTTLPAQEKRMTLSQCVEIATEHSLQAFRAKNMYLSGYWAFRTYKAGRLPFVSLQLTPVQYNSNFIKRYDYNQNIEVYRQQQSIASSAGLSLSQNLDLTGGTFTFNSGLDYLRNFGENIYTQYSTIPVRMGYSQSLFGFNRFKWEKDDKIYPDLPEKTEEISITAAEAIAAMKENNPDILACRQQVLESEQEVISVIAEFQKQQKLIARAVDALQMAITSYNINKQRFLVGKADVNTLTLSLNRRKEAQRNYLSALSNYWQGYYAIRKLTLFDFEKRETLSFQFDKLFE